MAGANMNGKMLLGVALIAIGVIALVYQGFGYTTRKKVLDMGPIQATKEEHHSIPLPPIIGVIALISGVAVLATGRK
jgi:drug/metabolite transporter (DMT)-like permease